LRLRYALYTDVLATRNRAEFSVTVDGGRPRRRIGTANTLTLGQLNQVADFAAGESATSGASVGQRLQRIGVATVQLGDDLPAGHHRVRLQALSSGRYWARFWILGRPHHHESAASWLTAEAAELSEVEQ
jgi:hypothetical protein